MKPNLGKFDRVFRILMAVALLAAAILLTAPLPLRIGLGAAGVMLAATALARRCPGYACMGVSTAGPTT
ncbi:MAG TPA: DUF2892 domain-containing protein [bacterium]